MQVIANNMPERQVFLRIRRAAECGYFDGSSLSEYLNQCRWFLEKYQCVVIFTRDIGHHSCGWWKNPDYERCYHLSLSFPGGRNRKGFNAVINNLFGRDKKWIWTEPPYSDDGKKVGVWHYRLFCDVAWQPIKPRGEVYSKQFTERGWKSFSELH